MLGTLLIISCAVLWATDTIFRMPLVKSVDTGTIVLIEHAICVLSTLPLCLLRYRETRALKGKGWLALAFIGLLGSALGSYCFTLSYRFINPSVAILLQKTQPIFAILGARVVLREKPRSGFYGWALVAILSSTMISAPEIWRPEEIARAFPSLRRGLDHLQSQGQARAQAGIFLALGASLVWGLSTVFGKWITNKMSFPVTSFFRFLFGFLGMLLLTLVRAWHAKVPLGNLFVYFSTDHDAVHSILYMGLVSGTLAMYLYYAGLKRTRASVATFAEMFFPVAAVIINWRFLGQPLAALQLSGMILLLIAVFFIVRENRGVR